MHAQSPPRFNLTATPATTCRIPIFSPTRRPKEVKNLRIDTAWGWALVNGRLGQQHLDLLDAARSVASREEQTLDGRFHLLVDRAKLRSALGGDSTNYARISECLDDLMRALVVVHNRSLDETIRGGLISEVADSPSIPATRFGAFSSGRRNLRISFGKGWSKLLDGQQIHYPLREVICLQRGFSQAVARFCWSHARINETLGGLCAKLAAEGRVRDRLADLLVDEAALGEIGIEIRNGCVFCDRRANRVPVSTMRREQSPGAREQSPG